MTAPKGMISLAEAMKIALARQSTGTPSLLAECAETLKRIDSKSPGAGAEPITTDARARGEGGRPNEGFDSPDRGQQRSKP